VRAFSSDRGRNPSLTRWIVVCTWWEKKENGKKKEEKENSIIVDFHGQLSDLTLYLSLPVER
jgi:hypothetical protein